MNTGISRVSITAQFSDIDQAVESLRNGKGRNNSSEVVGDIVSVLCQCSNVYTTNPAIEGIGSFEFGNLPWHHRLMILASQPVRQLTDDDLVNTVYGMWGEDDFTPVRVSAQAALDSIFGQKLWFYTGNSFVSAEATQEGDDSALHIRVGGNNCKTECEYQEYGCILTGKNRSLKIVD